MLQINAMSYIASTSLHPLITQNLVDTRKYFCPFLEKGYCREASRCNFSHDNCQSFKIPDDYCHFYLANQCLYGQDCKFRHCEPITESLDINYEETTTANITTTTTTTTTTTFEEDSNFEAYSDHVTDAPRESYREWSTCNEESQAFEELSQKFSLSLPSISSVSPRPPTSYAKICKSRTSVNQQQQDTSNPKKNYPLCPYSSISGECQFPPGHCSYIHGLDCDLCGRPCLHPYDMEQQRQHREDCLKEHEREMELSFAVQRSKDKVCGICMDTVVEKKPITSSRFGILEKCNHIFCLDCIRKWRGTKQFETRTIRACPECRVNSDFVVPSKYWVEDQDDKDKLIHDYKEALRSKSCKYFNEGKGECPFAGSCFYKHAYPDGSIAKMDTPKPRRRVFGARGPTSTVANYILWNILTSTDEDDWSNDELESLYQGTDFETTDEEFPHDEETLRILYDI